MNLKKAKLFLVTLAAVSVFALTACGSENTAETENSDFFSTMETTDLNGNKVTGADFSKNRLTLVNVWNTGCTPCVQELPILDKLNKEYAYKKVAIKGLYFDLDPNLSEDTRQEINDVLADTKTEFQQILLTKEMLDSDLIKNLDAIPTTYLVDSKGNIIDVINSSSDYNGWKDIIEKGLKKVMKDA